MTPSRSAIARKVMTDLDWRSGDQQPPEIVRAFADGCGLSPHTVRRLMNERGVHIVRGAAKVRAFKPSLKRSSEPRARLATIPAIHPEVRTHAQDES